MRSPHELDRAEIIDLLNRCWMSHDGMWFYHCMKEFGIEKANEINKAAIQSLVPLEIERIKKILGIEKKIDTFQDLKSFFIPASQLFIPDFMNVTMSFLHENILHWEFAPKGCFAYKGIKRIGVIDRYECGVIYRLQCWFDSLGINYSVTPRIGRCLMLDHETCSGDFEFDFQ